MIGGIVLAVVVGGLMLSAKVLKTQRDSARADLEQVRAEFAGFVAEAKRKGDEQEAKTADTEKKWKEVLSNAAKRYQTDLAGRDAAIRRLRERPPVRPDSSAVPIATGCAPSPDGTAREWISLAEYRELEARAYDDALRLTRLQQWIRDTGHPMQ